MNRLKTTHLLSLLTILMVFMGNAIGGKTGMVFAFSMALAMNFFSYWFSDRNFLKLIPSTNKRNKRERRT